MCGIFAAIKKEGFFSIDHFDDFVKSTDIVKYRGPDSSGYMAINSFSKRIDKQQYNVFLGHRRLSIIDLSDDGNQPMHFDDLFIIFNGEIFNYIELREDLKKSGYQFKTNSDTEVILKLYSEYGEDGFRLLNGMWAFLLLDLRNNRIIASRDRFSIKPLFYLETKNDIYFASEAKQLFKYLHKKEINPETMNIFLQQGLLDIDESSFFKNIKRIYPKHNFIYSFKDEKILYKKYWDYTIGTNEFSFNDAIENFTELFTDSIKIRLRSDVEVGILLSGGLDSSAITLTSQKILQNQIKTYSVISDNSESSEEEFIDLLIKSNHVDNIKLTIESNKIINHFNEVLKHQDEPFNYFIVLAHYDLIKKLAEESDIIVILNGQGGDEALMGYLRYYLFYWKYLLKEKQIVDLTKEIFFGLINRTIFSQLKLNAAKRYIPKLLTSDKNFLLNKTILLDVWNFPSLKDAQINDIDKYSVPFIARYEDRNSMAFSKEIRLPFLDHRLVEFLINIQNNFKMKNGWTKYLLRKSMSNLPQKIKWRRDKKGFSIPEEQWIKEDFKSEIFSLFKYQESYLEKFGFVDGKMFIKYYESYLDGNSQIHSTDISRIFIAEKWMREHFS